MQFAQGSRRIDIPVLGEPPKDLVVLSLLSIICLSIGVNTAFAVDAVISVVPEFSIVAVGQNFQINVSISNVANLYAWEFKLFYLNAILNCTQAVEGPFLKGFAFTLFISQINNGYNSTHGRVLLACSLTGSAIADGSGDLASMTFRAKKGGNTALDLVDTKLKGPSLPPEDISHIAVDGSVHVIGNIHDVAVIGIVSSKAGGVPKSVVGRGNTVRINVTVENQGDFDETFNILVYANSTQVGTLGITNMPWSTRTTVQIIWDTTEFVYGNYQLNAQATSVFNESDLADNTLADGSLLVSIPGDVDGSFLVNIFDVVRITSCYGKKRGDPQYNPSADLDDNNVVNIFDVVICTGNYGKKYP